MTAPMVRIEGGTYAMGAVDFYPEEGPVVTRHVETFWLDASPVTNDQFAQFVDSTGWVTSAERDLDPVDFDHELPSHAPGSLVFTPTDRPVDLRDWRQWWSWVEGASWRHPLGPGSDIDGRGEHPVVHVSRLDAEAYAKWVGKRLPTEIEWEYAARGGLEGHSYAWGDLPHHSGALRANTWQGRFPYDNRGACGWVGTSPVGVFPPNGFGLLDMIGNVWEWTSDTWTDGHDDSAEILSASGSGCGCSRGSTSGPRPDGLLKGGSHLCAPEYCLRYRPAARSRQDPASSATHIGMRLAR